MLQAITHNYHNHSDNTQNFHIQETTRNWYKNSDSNGTITPNLVHNFSVNITLSSFDIDDHSWWTLKPLLQNLLQEDFQHSFLFLFGWKRCFQKVQGSVFIQQLLSGRV